MQSIYIPLFLMNKKDQSLLILEAAIVNSGIGFWGPSAPPLDLGLKMV